MKKLVMWAVGVPFIVAVMVMVSFEMPGAQDVALVTTHIPQ